MFFTRALLILAASLSFCTILSTYLIGRFLGHFNNVIPFISSSLDYPPESCIGTLGLSLVAFTVALIGIIKFRFEQLLIDRKLGLQSGDNIIKKFQVSNNISLIVILLSMVGLVGVVSFQYHLIPICHLVSAFLFFVGAVIYMNIIAFLDLKLSKTQYYSGNDLEYNLVAKTNQNSVAFAYFRIALAEVSIIFFVIFFVLQFSVESLLQSISALFEIICAAVLFIFVISYWKEFSIMKLTLRIDHPYLDNDFTLNQ